MPRKLRNAARVLLGIGRLGVDDACKYVGTAFEIGPADDAQLTMGFHFRLVLVHRIGLQCQPERLTFRQREKGIDEFGSEEPPAFGRQPHPDLRDMRQRALIGMERSRQDIDAIGEKDQVGEQRRLWCQRSLPLQRFPARMMVADDRRQDRQWRKIIQQICAADAMRLGPRPFEIGHQATMYNGMTKRRSHGAGRRRRAAVAPSRRARVGPSSRASMPTRRPCSRSSTPTRSTALAIVITS